MKVSKGCHYVLQIINKYILKKMRCRTLLLSVSASMTRLTLLSLNVILEETCHRFICLIPRNSRLIAVCRRCKSPAINLNLRASVFPKKKLNLCDTRVVLLASNKTYSPRFIAIASRRNSCSLRFRCHDISIDNILLLKS